MVGKELQEPKLWPRAAVDDLREQFRVRGELLAHVAPPLADFGRYFLELDFAAHVPLAADWPHVDEAERSLRRSAIVALESVLRERVLARARGGRPTPLDPDPGGAERRQFQCISDLFLGLIDRAAFLRGTASSAARAYRVGLAYECFANGELAVPGLPATHGQPNGANLFCFGEFALMAAEAGVDRARWVELAPALLRCQEIFVSVYGPDHGRPIPWDAYSTLRTRAVEPWSARRKSQARPRYAGTELAALEALADRNAQTALRAE